MPWTSEISTRARGSGTVWTQREGRDPNANLVRFSQGESVGEHVNGEVDVLFVGVSGSGVVEVDGREHALGPGVLILAPKESDGPPEARPRIFPTSPCTKDGDRCAFEPAKGGRTREAPTDSRETLGRSRPQKRRSGPVQGRGVVADLVLHEGGDHVAGVVLALPAVESQRLPRPGAGFLQGLRT